MGLHRKAYAALAVLTCAAIATPAMSYDWIATGHVKDIETTYGPFSLPIVIDVAAGSCAAGAQLTWNPIGSTTEDKVASFSAALAVFLTAQAQGTTITIAGNNSGCIIQYVHKS